MKPEFLNGASVTRVWSDYASELLAAFQYQTDAIEFARGKVAEDVKREWHCFYIVACSMRGTVCVIRQEVT